MTRKGNIRGAELDELSRRIPGAGIEVHSALGPGLLEIKSVRQVIPIHHAQLLTYLKLSGIHLGFVLNFNVSRLKQGITRLVHDCPG